MVLHTHRHTHRHTHTHTYIYIYIYVYGDYDDINLLDIKHKIKVINTSRSAVK